MVGLIFHFLLAIWLVCSATAVSAAEINYTYDIRYDLTLEGTIVPGDYDKLRKFLEEYCFAPLDSCVKSIFLASPGGSVIEAMKIGRLVRMLRLKIGVPEEHAPEHRQTFIGALKLRDPKVNYLCTSACFFIAVAGIERVHNTRPILGIHRPFMTDADLKALSANQVIASATEVRTVVEAYLKEMGVPLKYADLMFSIPKEQVRWITGAEYEADFSGVVPELRDWLSARCDKRSDVEKRLDNLFDAKIRRGEELSPEELDMLVAVRKKVEVQVRCEIPLKAKMRQEAWKTYKGL